MTEDIISADGTARAAIEWASSAQPVGYVTAVRLMEERAASIAAGRAAELIWLLEHPALYTAGTSAKTADLLEPGRLPVHETGRGGEITYHGPGQRIAYVMLDVRRRFGGDVHAFVGAIEAWIIDALDALGVRGKTHAGRVGVWVGGGEGLAAAAKIAAIGIRVRRGVSFHGLALNVDPDLSQFDGIVPCGIRDAGVTSLAALGIAASMKDVDISLRGAFEARFGAVRPVPGPREADPDPSGTGRDARV